ncbi:MAG: hypothetical protein ACREOK_14955, partial [Gemmatimonadaceae bacterium]
MKWSAYDRRKSDGDSAIAGDGSRTAASVAADAPRAIAIATEPGAREGEAQRSAGETAGQSSETVWTEAPADGVSPMGTSAPSADSGHAAYDLLKGLELFLFIEASHV